MKKGLIAVIIVLGLALVASGVFCFTLINNNNSLTAELHSVQSELASTQAELASTNQTLASTVTELGTTKDTLTSVRSELASTKDTLSSTRSELNNTNQTLASKLLELSSTIDIYYAAQKSLTTAEDSLTSTQKKLASAQDTLSGLGITVASSMECWDVQLVDNPSATNPTWQQLKGFLAFDNTENHTYVADVYDCSQFSRDLHNHAEAAGIRAAEVQVYFTNDYVGHALCAFRTTDYGLVYIDCTGAPDKIAYIKRFKVLKAVDVKSVVDPSNTRSDSWWASRISYYSVGARDGTRGITSEIRIFW